MSALSRLLLVWFVTLALPLQGLAAATRLVCGPATSAGLAGSATLQAPASHGLQPHAAAAG